MLSVVTITKAEPHALHFIAQMRMLADICKGELVIVVDGDVAPLEYEHYADRLGYVHSNGYIEGSLSAAFGMCKGDWMLRLDDDEKASPAMMDWLRNERYLEQSNGTVTFPRANLWQDKKHYITNPPLFPDYQTRLEKRGFAVNRNSIHEAHPLGHGTIVPVMIEHYKFLVKSYAQRVEIAERYESIRDGAGFSDTYLPFGLPEDAFDFICVEKLGAGEFKQ